MEITQEDFEAYEDIRASGVTNMMALRTVSELSGLDRDQILAIQKDYTALKEKYCGEKEEA